MHVKGESSDIYTPLSCFSQSGSTPVIKLALTSAVREGGDEELHITRNLVYH